ncbi:MAG: cell division protein ZapB, partial [Spirochaetales bacterium]|nr:cell division protein ZapB [Spirochaetales bacterium]
IKQLDHKVRKAIDKISTLNNENKMLQEKLDNYQLRIEELEVLIDTFKEDQGEIESGIIDALNQLDILEDNIVNHEADSEPAQESAEDQPSEESEITEETTGVAVVADTQEETADSNNDESESADSSESKESELDIF